MSSPIFFKKTGGEFIVIRFCFFCHRHTQTHTDRYPNTEYGDYAKIMP